MFLFGVTGGIGSGKTVVCNFLKEKDIPIIEADPLAKQLTSQLPEIRQALIEKFGDDVYTANGELNKEKLSKLVFSDPSTRLQVNDIIHPPVLHWIKEEARRLYKEENQPLVGVEAALIYESQMEQILDAVVVVNAPLENRIRWIQKRNNFSEEEILERINSQMPISEKVKRADYVLENEGSLTDLAKQVDALYDWLCLRIQSRAERRGS